MQRDSNYRVGQVYATNDKIDSLILRLERKDARLQALVSELRQRVYNLEFQIIQAPYKNQMDEIDYLEY